VPRGRERLLVLHIVGQYPMAGVAWQAIHYLLGFQQLGWDVYYVEDSGASPYDRWLQGDDEAQLTETFERLRASGYRTVKVKIGFDVEADLRTLAAMQKVVAGRAAIRVDANQGYTAAQALAFVGSADPAGVELFEQPGAAGDVDAHARVAVAAAARGLPPRLGESIYMLFARPLAVDNGDIVIEPGVPALDADALAFHTRAHQTFHPKSAGCRTRS
jgi:L-alanine-DL-glutamate epimerase-like enolase superfamily enzyme